MELNAKIILAALAAIAATGTAEAHAQEGIQAGLDLLQDIAVIAGFLIVVAGIPAIIVIVIMRRRKTAKEPSFGQAVNPPESDVTKSRFLRRGLENKPVGKYRSYHDRPGEDTIPATGKLFLDSSSALAIMGGTVSPDGPTSERIVITATVRREIDGVSANTAGYDRDMLPGYSNVLERGPGFDHYLSEFEMIQKKALQDPTGDLAARWMESKQRYLDEKHGIGPNALGLGGAINEKAAKHALSTLFEEAGSDRIIVAEAASLSDSGATIVSSDGDILAFYREISGMTGGRLKAARTESLRA